MHSTNYIVCVFCVTAGQNGENLGSDEEEIVLLAYLLYDVIANKVLDVQFHHVSPTHHDGSDSSHSYILTEECKIQTGLSEDVIRNAMPLEVVLKEFEKFLINHQLHPDHGARPFSLCTDGQLHLRMCLVPEATYKNINLPPFHFRFFDLRREFKKFYKTEDRPINCLHDMFEFLGIERMDSVEYGLKQCHNMATLLHKLIGDGHVFSEPEYIKDKLEPGVCGKDENVDDETVVRARGLPWQSSDQDIARFFRGLNVERGGVALCLSPQGRRNGEALIRFESKDHRDLALRKHKHHIGQRYIEVYRASGEDFIGVAGGSSTEAQEFLSRHSDGGCQIIVRMRGLPYICKAEQVMEFFKEEPNSVDVLDGPEGVLFVHQADGRATGDAFVLFSSEEAAANALSKHRQCIGTRYIELFKSTTAEVQQVLNRSLDPRANLSSSSSSECMDITIPSIQPLIATFPATLQPTASIIFPPQMSANSKRDCVMIKGLPYEAQVNDILTFLGDHSKHVITQGVHLVYNPRGTPFGEALIQMDCELNAELTCLGRNKKTMYTSGGKKSCLEVAQYSMDEISLLYNSGISAVMSPRMVSTLVCNVAPTAPTVPILIPPNVPPPPIPSSHNIVPINRQILPSPGVGQSFVTPGMDTTLLAPAALYNTSGSLYAFHQPTVNQPSFNTTGVVQTTFQAHSLTPQATQCRGPMTLTSAQPGSFAFQPIVYWYPGTPVSSQSTYYVPTFPTTVAIKGLPSNIQTQDVINFLEGQFEIAPDVQILRSQDGRANRDAYVTFASRQEAERVIQEYQRKSYGNRMIEMFIV